MTDAQVLTLWDDCFNRVTQVTDHFRFDVRDGVLFNREKIEIHIGAKWQSRVRVCHISVGYFMVPLAVPRTVKAGDLFSFDPGMLIIDCRGILQ